MKLFKISVISIISILIFQSQLYGINLRCDFKQRLNDRELNGVKCSVNYSPPLCVIESNDKFKKWVSEVIINNKDVVVMKEPSNYVRGSKTNQEIRKLRKSDKERGLIVESVVHHINDGDYKSDRSIFVIKDSGEIYNSFLYTLFFDNISKQSILTQCVSLTPSGTNRHKNWTNSYYGECEVLD